MPTYGVKPWRSGYPPRGSIISGTSGSAADDTSPFGVTAIDTWWTDAAFRAYAAHTRSDEFAAGLADLLAIVPTRQVVIMCSETLWWRCHRRLIADVATLAHHGPVDHLLPSGRREPHEPAVGARRSADGHIVWDAGATRLPIESGC